MLPFIKLNKKSEITDEPDVIELNKKSEITDEPDVIIDAQRRKFRKIIIIVLLAAVLVAGAVFALINFIISDQDENAIIQSKFSLHYEMEVSEDPYVKVLFVSIRMDIDKLSPDKLIYIYRSMVGASMLSCVDNDGNELETRESTDLLAIGPIAPEAESVTMKYAIMVGASRDYVHSIGDFYSDLLVFSGENVLMMPYLDYAALKKPYKYISSVSFTLDPGAYDWKAIIPFQEPLSDDLSFSIDKPTWSDFSAISKSSYCFGQFEKQPIGKGGTVYFDKAIIGKVTPLSSETLTSFWNYYTDLFGELSPDAPLVLLRNATEDNTAILGGVGAKGAAISADTINADGCQTLSSTLYHLFFDSKILAPNLHYPPNNWLYSGLSSFHVLKSGSSLSQEVKNMYSMEVIDQPEMDYLDYLYFSIKEPDFLTLNPSMEGNMDQVQGMFYMDIKVPVMLDLIDYAIEESGGGNLITALLDATSRDKEKDLDIEKFLKAKCGNYFDAVTRCFSGNALIPNYKNFRLEEKFSEEEITMRLTNTDVDFTNLFSHGHGYIGYISFLILLLDTEVFFKDVEALGVSYSSEEVQEEIEGFSPILHQYLMQYAMFAKLSGYDQLTFENVKSMYTVANFNMWMEYCENVGFRD